MRKIKEAKVEPIEIQFYRKIFETACSIGRENIDRICNRVEKDKAAPFPLKLILQGLSWIDFHEAFQACENLSKSLSEKIVDLNLYKQIRLKEAEQRRIT